MGLSVSWGIDFSGGVESGGLVSHWTFVDHFVEGGIAQILIPEKLCFRLLGIGGGVDKEHVGRGILLVVF
jgi:hypothetical protein